jgi:hypothetical protein
MPSKGACRTSHHRAAVIPAAARDPRPAGQAQGEPAVPLTSPPVALEPRLRAGGP